MSLSTLLQTYTRTFKAEELTKFDVTNNNIKKCMDKNHQKYKSKAKPHHKLGISAFQLADDPPKIDKTIIFTREMHTFGKYV